MLINGKESLTVKFEGLHGKSQRELHKKLKDMLTLANVAPSRVIEVPTPFKTMPAEELEKLSETPVSVPETEIAPETTVSVPETDTISVADDTDHKNEDRPVKNEEFLGNASNMAPDTETQEQSVEEETVEDLPKKKKSGKKSKKGK
jgi:hypothetical protein